MNLIHSQIYNDILVLQTAVSGCRWIPAYDPMGLLPSDSRLLVSLCESVDERFYDTVASAIPVTASAVSLELRKKFEADRDPDTANIVQHLVNLTRENGIIGSVEQARRRRAPLFQQVQAFLHTIHS